MTNARRRATRSDTAVAKADGDEDQGHEAAIERLREFAENGLDDPALDGLDDVDPVAVAAVAGDVLGHETPDAAELRAHLRVVEAMVFASPQPLSEKKIAAHLPPETDVGALLVQLQAEYSDRGVHLVRVAGKWAFRTADDLSYLLEKHAVEQRRLSKAALETLAIIAYHQPVTRAEIEEIRGVQTSRGTLDVLMETAWIRPRGRRRSPGKPLTYGTTDEFLSHFGLESVGDLPGLAELKGAGLLDSDLPPNFSVPDPKDVAALMPDELPLEDEGVETTEPGMDNNDVDTPAEEEGEEQDETEVRN